MGQAISHIPQQFYPICCGEDSGSGDVLARVNPLLKIFQEIQEIFSASRGRRSETVGRYFM
jgi:hypothetical protein